MKTLYTGGTFDLFHFGHVEFLKKCKMISDKVIVALNTDQFVSEYKHPPIMSFSERKRSLLNCQYVDEVVPNICGANSKPSILYVKPQIIAIGDDWAHKDYFKQMQFTREWLDEKEIVLVYIPYCQDISTTELKKRLLNYL
jgi:glycerol-3-phosphate cytidylyltransferase